MSGERLRTARLELIGANLDLVRAMAEGAGALSRALGADVPERWLVEMLSPEIVKWLIGFYEKDRTAGGWGMWFIVLRERDYGPVLIGSGGFKGRPGAVGGPGTVEVGYGLMVSHQKRGYATEATEALVGWAMGHGEVTRVIAHTFERHEPSIGVLRRCGFLLAGPGFEVVDERDRQGRGELVFFELTRERWVKRIEGISEHPPTPRPQPNTDGTKELSPATDEE